MAYTYNREHDAFRGDERSRGLSSGHHVAQGGTTDASFASLEPNKIRSPRLRRDRSVCLRGTSWDYHQSHAPVDIRTTKDRQKEQRYERRASLSGYHTFSTTRGAADVPSVREYARKKDPFYRLDTSARDPYKRRVSTTGYYSYSPADAPSVGNPPPLSLKNSCGKIQNPAYYKSGDPYAPPEYHSPRHNSRRSSTGGNHYHSTLESHDCHSPRMTIPNDSGTFQKSQRECEGGPFHQRTSITLAERHLEDAIGELRNDTYDINRDYTSRLLDPDSSIPSMIYSETSCSMDFEVEEDEDRWGNTILSMSASNQYKEEEANCDDSKPQAKTFPPSKTQSSSSQFKEASIRKDKAAVIEIEPGHFMELRGAEETIRAIENDFFSPCSCVCCSLLLFCIQDASFVLCPACRVVIPVGTSSDNSGGVGMGFTFDQLSTWQKGV